MTCVSCRHSKGVVDPKNLGHATIFCRRYPPTVTLIPTPRGLVRDSSFPEVAHDTSCGEYALDASKPPA